MLFQPDPEDDEPDIPNRPWPDDDDDDEFKRSGNESALFTSWGGFVITIDRRLI